MVRDQESQLPNQRASRIEQSRRNDPPGTIERYRTTRRSKEGLHLYVVLRLAAAQDKKTGITRQIAQRLEQPGPRVAPFTAHGTGRHPPAAAILLAEPRVEAHAHDVRRARARLLQPLERLVDLEHLHSDT